MYPILRHLTNQITFFDTFQECISIMYLMLGYDIDKTIDEAMLGFMEIIFSPLNTALVKFNQTPYFLEAINLQLVNFYSNKYLSYQSYLVYLILYFQILNFQHIEINKEDESRNRIIEWIALVRKHAKNEGFPNFVGYFMYRLQIILLQGSSSHNLS